MRYLLFLLILLLPCVVNAAGVNALITKTATVSDWIGVDTTITDTVLLARSIVTEHRKRHSVFSANAVSKASPEVMSANHKYEVDRVIKQLQAIGFKDIQDFIQQSNDKDKAAGLKVEEWWQ